MLLLACSVKLKEDDLRSSQRSPNISSCSVYCTLPEGDGSIYPVVYLYKSSLMTRPQEMPSRKSRGFPTIPLCPVVRPESLFLSLLGAVYVVSSRHRVSGGESGNELIWDCHKQS